MLEMIFHHRLNLSQHTMISIENHHLYRLLLKEQIRFNVDIFSLFFFVFSTLKLINLFLASSVRVSSNDNNSIETRFDLMIKTPQIIWLENQHDANSNCLVISVRISTKVMNIFVFCLVILTDSNDHYLGRDSFVWFN